MRHPPAERAVDRGAVASRRAATRSERSRAAVAAAAEPRRHPHPHARFREARADRRPVPSGR
jgi:hypothetical protein